MSNQLQVSGEAKIRSIQGPVVANSGVITALNGDATQYVRGDGTLADFPTSTGGGSSVSYYLNTSVSQGTIGGVAYKQLSKTPISGAGTDVSTSVDGYIASYITDANDPALLEVPAGNFNCEFYFSVNSNAHNPYVYAELYKYDGTTFTLLGSSQSVPEYLTNGTTLSPYYFAIPVATSVLTITDRIAIRIYVNVDGRTVTLHTENNHLCQVVTTFSKGLISLNNLIRQNQFFQTGTSGTDFNISSTTATHTFNLPVASATNTGKLSSTDWSTFNGKVPYTGATANVDLGNFNFDANEISGASIIAKLNGPASSPFILMSGSSGYTIGNDAISLISSPNVANTLIITSNISTVTKTAQIGLGSLSATRTYTLPDASGTLALLESTQVFSGSNTFTNNTIFSASPLFDQSANYKVGASLVGTGNYIGMAFDKSGTGSSSTLSMKLADGTSVKAINLDFVGSPATYTYTFPASSGTLALLQSTQTFSGSNTFSGFASFTSTSGTSLQYGAVIQKGFTPLVFGSNITNIYSDATTNNLVIRDNLSIANLVFNNSTQTYTFPAASGTIALTSNLSSYLPLTGGTLTGALSGTSATFSSSVQADFLVVGTTAATSGGLRLGTQVAIRARNVANTANIPLIESTASDGVSVSNGALILASTGAATFSSTLSATTGYFSGNVVIDNTSLNNPKFLQFDANINSGANAVLGDIRWYNKQWDASIKAQIVALTDTDITNGRLSFRTGTDGVNAIERLRISSTGAATFSSLAGSGSRTVTANASGTLSASSDSSLKQEDILHKIEGLAEILQLKPRAYKWLNDIEIRGEDATTEIGFFADEVNAIIPSAAPKGNDDLYGFYDRAVIAALVKSIQEQQAQIQSLQEQINILSNK